MAFGTTVGGTPLVKAYVGTTPTKRIYVGGTHVWPPISAGKVIWIGSTVAAGTTNTFPTHIAGDLLAVLLIGTDAAPAGYTLAKSQTSPMKVALAYKWATASNTSVGTLTGASTNCAYVFRNANTTTPFGATGITSNSGLTATAPALTLTDPSGDSVIAHAFAQTGTTGAWVNKIQANFITKNQNARLANNQMIDTETATAESSTMTHSASASWTGMAFEVLAPTPVVQNGLYDVQIEYLPNYTVKFTALTSYADDPDNDAFFFRATPLNQNDGYKGRTWTSTFTASAGWQTGTVQDYWGGPGGVPPKTITFQFSPNAAGTNVAAEMFDGAADVTRQAGAIKGNADSGLYHLPGDPHYDETIAEQTFTTEAEAKAAGFIKYTKRKKKS